MKEKSKILYFYGIVALESGYIYYILILLYIIMYVIMISMSFICMFCMVYAGLSTPVYCDELVIGLGNPFCDELVEMWAVTPALAYITGTPEEIYGVSVGAPSFDIYKDSDHPLVARYDVDPTRICS